MGTPDFAVESLTALYESDYDIRLVVTQKDKRRGRGKKLQYTSVKQKALDLNLDVYQPDNINDEESLDILKEIDPDFIVVVAYGQILKKKLLDIPKYMCINVHASLLPKYRGAAPINWSIIDGEEKTGITIMEMSEGLDTGDMISKSEIPIELEDDYISLHDKLAEIGGKLLIDTLDEIIKGKSEKVPQDDKISSYAPMIFKSTGKIDWDSKGKDILNLIRGLVPWPVAFTKYKDDNFKIYKADLTDKKNMEPAGTIVEASDEGIFVNTSDKTLIIKELQFPNKKRVKVEDYLRGNTIEVGTLLK